MLIECEAQFTLDFLVRLEGDKFLEALFVFVLDLHYQGTSALVYLGFPGFGDFLQSQLISPFIMFIYKLCSFNKFTKLNYFINLELYFCIFCNKMFEYPLTRFNVLFVYKLREESHYISESIDLSVLQRWAFSFLEKYTLLNNLPPAASPIQLIMPLLSHLIIILHQHTLNFPHRHQLKQIKYPFSHAVLPLLTVGHFFSV